MGEARERECYMEVFSEWQPESERLFVGRATSMLRAPVGLIMGVSGVRRVCYKAKLECCGKITGIIWQWCGTAIPER